MSDNNDEQRGQAEGKSPSVQDKYAVSSKASLKDVRSEEEQPKIKMTFSQWFTNVFFYHYKWYTLGGVAAAVIIFSLTYSIVTNLSNRPDVKIVVVMGVNLAVEEFDPAKQSVVQAFNDVRGDTRAIVQMELLPFDERYPENVAYMYDKLVSILASGDTVLYLVDRKGLEIMHVFEAVARLDDLGLAEKYAYLDPLDGEAIPIYDIPSIAEIGFGEEYPLYAIFRVHSAGLRDSLYEAAVTALDAMLEYAQ